MPYKIGSGPSLEDVFHSENVFVNNVPVALWMEPIASAVTASPEPVTVPLTSVQVSEIQSSAASSTSEDEVASGLSNVGEVPPSSSDSSLATPDLRGPISSDLYTAVAQVISGALAEAALGDWKETGTNVRILDAFKSVGFNISNDGTTPWCAAFAGTVLKRAGAPALKTLSSRAYVSYGTEVDVSDPSAWRLNDIIIFSRGEGKGHIGFFRGYNPDNGVILVAGGNQHDELNETGFLLNGNSMSVTNVRRAWSIPKDYDVSIENKSITRGRSSKVV